MALALRTLSCSFLMTGFRRESRAGRSRLSETSSRWPWTGSRPFSGLMVLAT